MKIGLGFLFAAAVGAVGTVLAASLPVPPSLPKIGATHVSAPPTQVAAAPVAPPPAEPTIPPAPPPPAAVTPPQALAISPAVAPTPATVRPKRVVAAVSRNTDSTHTAKRPIRHLAKATPDRHPRAVAHAAAPRYGAVVPKPPPPFPGTVRERTHVAMAPPPYGMPPPYWRMPYPPEY